LGSHSLITREDIILLIPYCSAYFWSIKAWFYSQDRSSGPDGDDLSRNLEVFGIDLFTVTYTIILAKSKNRRQQCTCRYMYVQLALERKAQIRINAHRHAPEHQTDREAHSRSLDQNHAHRADGGLEALKWLLNHVPRCRPGPPGIGFRRPDFS